jgi:hypothetical protein
MNRYEYLVNHYVKANLVQQSDFDKILMSDPTAAVDANANIGRVGKYTQWMLNLFVHKRLEISGSDLQEIEEYIFKYDRIKHLLKPEHKDINKLKNRLVLKSLVESKWEEKYLFSKAEWKRTVKRKHVQYVYEDESFDIVIPTSEYASYELAGPPISKWCTATKFDSYFHRYAKDGPIYMIRDKNQIISHGKCAGEPKPLYQVHFESGLFCDREDNHFDLVNFLNKNAKVKKFFKPRFVQAMKRATFSSRVMVTAAVELYNEDGFFIKRFIKIFKEYLQKESGSVSIGDYNLTALLCKEIGYHRVLDYVFQHLAENIDALHIRFRNYKGDGYNLPWSLGRFKMLKTLELDGFVKKIPESIGDLENLSLLLIGKNKVKTIPETIIKCKRLEIIDLKKSDIDITTLKIKKNVYVKHGKIN